MMRNLLFAAAAVLLACNGQEQSRESLKVGRPAEEDPDVDGFIAETVESIDAEESKSVSLESSTILIAEGALSQAVKLRMRVLQDPPDRPEIASLGNPKSDVLEFTYYDTSANAVLGSDIFEKPFQVHQILKEVDDRSDIRYVIVSSPNSEEEKVQLLAQEDISISGETLSLNSISAIFNLVVTHAIVFAVEITDGDVAATIITIEKSAEIENKGGNEIVETLRPNPPSNVNDGSNYESLSQSPLITWAASSSEEVVSYEVAIGSSAGQSDIEGWNDVGLTTAAQVSGLTLADGSTYYASVRAVSSDGKISTIAKGDGWNVTQPLDCSGLPSEWILVPGNAVAGQPDDFCVMKYEAKIVGFANGDQVYSANLSAESRATGTPWVNVTREQARTECEGLGNGFGLITNNMWQTLARNVELAQSSNGQLLNWETGSSEGTNEINRGNFGTSSLLEADGDDANGCFGYTSGPAADCGGAWHEQKRTHVLSNGEVVWDLGGNVWEWVKDDVYIDFSGGFISQISGIAKNVFGPIGDYLDKDSGNHGGLGALAIYIGGTAAIYRGGEMYQFANAGIFNASANETTTTSGSLGFRCAYVPVD